MKYSKEIAQQIIRNIEIIEQSYKVAEEVQDVILGAMAKVCENQLKKSPLVLTNDAEFDLGRGDYEACFTVNDWCNEEGIKFASYNIAGDINKQTVEADLAYYLSQLIGSGASTACYQVCFSLDKDQLNIKHSQYKKILRGSFEYMDKLQNVGFKLSENGLEVVYDFTLEQELLINEYPDFVDAFIPFTEALDCLISNHHLFDELVKKVSLAASKI